VISNIKSSKVFTKTKYKMGYRVKKIWKITLLFKIAWNITNEKTIIQVEPLKLQLSIQKVNSYIVKNLILRTGQSTLPFTSCSFERYLSFSGKHRCKHILWNIYISVKCFSLPKTVTFTSPSLMQFCQFV